MEINRGDMYKKEIDFLISTSYGPGRYDDNYEKKGLDYPYGYVRWTENRNMAEYLRLLQNGVIDISQMVNAVYPIEKVEEAFDVLKSGEDPKPIISILDYGVDLDIDLTKTISKRVDLVKSSSNSKIVNVALIGTGGFATGMHLPNMAKLSNKFKIKAIVNRTGQKSQSCCRTIQCGLCHNRHSRCT